MADAKDWYDSKGEDDEGNWWDNLEDREEPRNNDLWDDMKEILHPEIAHSPEISGGDLEAFADEAAPSSKSRFVRFLNGRTFPNSNEGNSKAVKNKIEEEFVPETC